MDIPKELQVLWELVRDSKAKGKYETIEKMDEVFGLDLLEFKKISKEERKLIEKRKKAKKDKDYETSDQIRNELIKRGHSVEDDLDSFSVSGARVFLDDKK